MKRSLTDTTSRKRIKTELGVGQKAGTAERWGRGTGEKLELEGTESIGAPKPGETKTDMGSPAAGEKLRAHEGPGAGTCTEGPQGLGDRKQRPPNTRPEGGAGDTP